MELDKTQLRRHMRQLRAQRPPAAVAAESVRIHARCRAFPALHQAQSLFCYLSAPGEVQTLPLLAPWLAQGQTILVPVLGTDKTMRLARLTSLDPAHLRAGWGGILEPVNPVWWEGTPEVTLAPGLAFTRRGERLGQGGGYYDRFLAAHPATRAIALAFADQIVEELPVTPLDQKVQWIVTPEEVVECENG